MDKIKNYFKKIFRRTDFSGLSICGRGQGFDWEILLTFFLLIMIIVVSYSVHVFLGVRAGDIFDEGSKTPPHNETIDKNNLNRIIQDFDAKAKILNSLQTQKPVFIDPSL